MQVLFTNQFAKDIRKLKDKSLAQNIELIINAVKDANNLSEITNVKKLKGHQYAYRIRIGDYRIGIFSKGDTIEFACFMSRKDIYKYFP